MQRCWKTGTANYTDRKRLLQTQKKQSDTKNAAKDSRTNTYKERFKRSR